eukprot:COSAG03_NODE_5402_length_1258_cov_1.723900_1_plen_30_part_10
MAILFGGNDHLIELNDIHHVTSGLSHSHSL